MRASAACPVLGCNRRCQQPWNPGDFRLVSSWTLNVQHLAQRGPESSRVSSGWCLFSLCCLFPFWKKEDQWTISAHMTSGNRGCCQSIFFLRKGRKKGKEIKKFKSLNTASSMTPLQNQYYPNKIMCRLYFFFSLTRTVSSFVCFTLPARNSVALWG